MSYLNVADSMSRAEATTGGEHSGNTPLIQRTQVRANMREQNTEARANMREQNTEANASTPNSSTRVSFTENMSTRSCIIKNGSCYTGKSDKIAALCEKIVNF